MQQRDDSTDTDTAASRLNELDTYFRQHPVTGPEGRSYTAFQARTPVAASPLPFDAAVVDHIDAAVAEVVDHTRSVNPDAAPLQGHVAGVYGWAWENTEGAAEMHRQRLETIEYRHRLEHAIRAGDNSVVRPHRCPACHTLGLMWPQGVTDPKGRAMCVNRHCANANGGQSHRWTLARLAYEHVAFEKTLRECAT